jgi:hypothetical protein
VTTTSELADRCANDALWLTNHTDTSTNGIVATLLTASKRLRELEAEVERLRAAMRPMLRSTDPEPPIGSVVIDIEGHRWERRLPERGWFPDNDDDCESWTRVAGNYGPVMLWVLGEDKGPHMMQSKWPSTPGEVTHALDGEDT